MSGLTVAVTCQDAAGATVLALTKAAGYTIESIETGTMSWRRVTVSAQDVPGFVDVQAVPDARTLLASVRVEAANQAALEAAKNALLAAVQVRAWRLAVALNGVTETWVCGPADTNASPIKELEMNLMRRVTLSIPAQPLPA